MTNYAKALIAFLRQIVVGATTIEVYQSEQVPDDATFPYLTVEIAQGDAFDTTYQTVFLWCQIGASRNTAEIQRAAILDSIRDLVPNKGAKLQYAGGMAMIYRNSDFTRYYNDPDDNTVIGARISLMIRHYEE